jgi:phosphomevalonate kinase
MKAISCSAPGKLFLGGEYAVLNGAEAVVTAVDRRVLAVPTRQQQHESPILKVVREQILHFLENERAKPMELPPIQVRSRDFHIGGKKIGLGSSAAVSAAASGLLFELAGLSIAENRHKILEQAIAAHTASQGGRGSGADVAAAVQGGTLIFTTAGCVEPVHTNSIHLVPVWSGKSASTKELIKSIDAFRESDPLGHRECFDELQARAAQLAQAYRRENALNIIDATQQYGKSMDRLGRASQAPIVTKKHALIANVASSLGGSAKPSGAGGGDAAVAVFADGEAAARFRTMCYRYELIPLDLKTDAPGLCRDEEQDPDITSAF